MYRVFLGAPTLNDLSQNGASTWHWETFDSDENVPAHEQPSIFPPSTLDQASRRISDFYRNVIFQDDSQEEEKEAERSLQFMNSNVKETTTFITWPPTAPRQPADITSISGPRDGSSTTFRTDEDSANQETQYESQYGGSDSSQVSISRFPQFHFSLQSLTSLSINNKRSNTVNNHNRKINLLLAVLEVDGPDAITIKNGKDAGKEVYVLKMILGDENAKMCKLTAWREVAEAWGGITEDVAAKRGDVVLLENVTISEPSPGATPNVTASPYMRSNMTICYRTLPYSEADGVFRPDLRIGESEPCVRKVAEVVTWFENMAGLH